VVSIVFTQMAPRTRPDIELASQLCSALVALPWIAFIHFIGAPRLIAWARIEGAADATTAIAAEASKKPASTPTTPTAPPKIDVVKATLVMVALLAILGASVLAMSKIFNLPIGAINDNRAFYYATVPLAILAAATDANSKLVAFYTIKPEGGEPTSGAEPAEAKPAAARVATKGAAPRGASKSPAAASARGKSPAPAARGKSPGRKAK
jgi:hypothetical protein